MTKIKITEKQAELLRSYRLNEASKQNAKKNVLKITKEQYDRIFASGLIKESMDSIDRTFKTEFANHDVKNLSPVAENDYPQGSKFSISQSNPSVTKSVQPKFGKPMMEGSDNLKKETIELVKYLYRKSEEFSPYWEQHDLTYDDICDTLKAKKMIVIKNGKCELSKSLGTPEEAMQKLEVELRNLIGGETSKGPELETENYPLGAQDDPRAPYNQEDPRLSRPTKPKSEPLKVVMYNKEIAILKGEDGSYYAFFYDSIDHKDFAEYAEREEMYAGMADGEPDFEYGDFEIDENVIQAYVNDNLNLLSKGQGLDAWESGVDLVKIDSALKQELISMYDKNQQITNILGSIQEISDDLGKNIKNYLGNSLSKPDISKGPEGETEKERLARLQAVIAKRRADSNAITKEKELDEMTSAASSGSFTAPIGMTSGKMPVDADKMDVPVVYETTSGSGSVGAYDANALPGIKRDGSFKETKQTKAEKNTQWAGGSFVDFNDCTKLNNKPAGSGCSQGAVDNVVKLKKTSGNINAPSLSKGKQ
jgi:hypothetical protein